MAITDYDLSDIAAVVNGSNGNGNGDGWGNGNGWWIILLFILLGGWGGNRGFGGNGSGYRRGYDGSRGRSGWANQYGRGYSRRGYESMGHGEPVEGIRNLMMAASPEEKERIKAEMRSMLEM